MGNCESKYSDQALKKNKSMSQEPINSSLVGNPVVVELLGARNVAKADIVSESDPYVRVSLRENDKTTAPLVPNSVEVTWPTIDDEPNPGWFTCKWVAAKANAGNVLHIMMFDEDATSDDLLAEVRLPVASLALDKVITLKLPYVEKKSLIQELDFRLRSGFPSPKKRVTIIRHGESEWNEAQSEKDLKTMVSRVDHPLTTEGAGQALTLAAKINAEMKKRSEQQAPAPAPAPAANSNDDAALDSFLNPSVVYVSPLCRAVQTALLALYPLGTKPAWELKKNAREKRNFGGRDSSGTTFGKDYLPFLVKELGVLDDGFKKDTELKNKDAMAPFPPQENLAQLLEKLDRTETASKWWTDDRESGDDASRRIGTLFFEQIMWDPRDNIVVVGHSHFFRDFMKNYFSPRMAEKAKSGATGYTLEQWGGHKLENCGTAHVELDYSPIIAAWQQGRPPTAEELKTIENVTLLCGTKLIP